MKNLILIIIAVLLLIGCKGEDQNKGSSTTPVTEDTTTDTTTPATEDTTTDTLSSNKAIFDFRFEAIHNNVLSSDVTTDISGDTITSTLPYGTSSLTALVATFTIDGSSVSVGGIEQTSGNTSNDFSNPVFYKVVAQDGTAQGYSVNINIDPGSLVWSFVDGGLDTGLNKNTTVSARTPKLAVFNSKLYATWHETDGTTDQIRVKEWNGTTWTFVDGDGTTGLNKDTTNMAYEPHLAAFNSKLYAIWTEIPADTISQIRVKQWDGTTWTFVDGNATTGLNKTGYRAYNPQLAVFNSKLYATWKEYSFTGKANQIRVKEWDGVTWSFVDGDGANGLNKDPTENASSPSLVVFNSKLYATWYESYLSEDQIRVKEWDSATWTFVDGDTATGLNKDTTKEARASQLVVFNSKLYATWHETDGTTDQIRVKEWNGATWSFVDGDGTTGLNKDTTNMAWNPQLAVFNSKLYGIWEEFNGSPQIRVKEWGGSAWSFVDGDMDTGLNKNVYKGAQTPHLTVFNSKLIATWSEGFNSGNQIRVVEAQLQ